MAASCFLRERTNRLQCVCRNRVGGCRYSDWKKISGCIYLYRKERLAVLKQNTLFRKLIALSIPTVLEQLLSTLMQYVDTAMVGRLGEQATAAVSTTTTIGWLIGSMFAAIGTAVLTLVSQGYGKGDRTFVQKFAQQALFVTFTLGIVIGVLAMVLAPLIPGWMGADPKIREAASEYFRIISIPMVLRGSSIVCGSALRALQDTKTPMLVSFLTNVLNLVLDYVLIYPMGFGVRGAAVATAVSSALSGLILLYVFFHHEWLRFRLRFFSPERTLLLQGLRVGLPVLGTSVTSCMGYVMFASLVSGMGTTIFAAHSIAVEAETLFYIPGYGLRTAASAMVGAAVGEKNPDKMRQICRMSIALTVGMMCMNGILLYIAAYPMMEIFTSSQAVAELGAQMLRIVAFTEPFFGLYIVMEGIYYGQGQTRYPFVIETFCMWGVRILSAFVVVHSLHGDLRMVWLCMIADNISKAVLLSIPMLCRRIKKHSSSRGV